MKQLIYILTAFLSIIYFAGCDFGDTIDPNGGGYYSPFYYGNRIEYDGYTYNNNYGSSTRNLNITFTSIGSVGYIQNNYAYGIIDSTFSYNSYGTGNLIRRDTLYFATHPNGDIQFLSYGYYRIIPRWIDLFRFSQVNSTYQQNFDEVIDGRRWTLRINSYITRTNIYTGFAGNLPVYKLEQRLQYTAPFNTDVTFYWYWSEEYGLMVYDEQRSGLIYQIARNKNFGY